MVATAVPFPTDRNRLWDAGRKCGNLIEGLLAAGSALPGGHQCKSWRRPRKAGARTASPLGYRGGPNPAARVKRAGRDSLAVGRERSRKVRQRLLGLCDETVAAARWARRAGGDALRDQPLDLVARRLVRAETGPAHEPGFSPNGPSSRSGSPVTS